jgi:hypothetical protein
MVERPLQQLLASSFYVTDIADQSSEVLQEYLAAHHVSILNWSLNGAEQRYAEACYNTIADAERNYNLHNSQSRDGMRFHIKRALTMIWVSGLPSVLYARDLFTSLNDVTPGLLRVTVPRNPE